MKSLKIFVLLSVLQSMVYSQSGWFQQNSGTNKIMNSCFFLNDFTGYVVGDLGVILKTTNGGTNWNNIYNQVIYDAISVSFLNNNTGWIYIENNTNLDSTFVLKTINAGISWNKFFVDTNDATLWFADFQFLNENTGYLANFISLKKTTNGGLNWFISFNQSSSGVFFINNFTGWTGGFGTGIYKTTDEGVTWIQQIGPLYHQYGTDIHFLNAQTGFFIHGYFGDYGYLYTTANSGINWNQYNLPYKVTSITFANENTGYMLAVYEFGANQYISKTTNRGLNWIIHNINAPKYHFLKEVFFSSVNTGWAVGDSGYIYKTTNGGVTIGIQPIGNQIPSKFSLSQNYPNPFNPVTKIRFDIPANVKSQKSNVKLVVYNMLGEEVEILVNEELQPGTYEADFDGSNLPSGIYFYRLQAGDYTETKKMVLLK